MKTKTYFVEYNTDDSSVIAKFSRKSARANLTNAMRLAEKNIKHNPVVMCGKEVIWNGEIV